MNEMKLSGRMDTIFINSEKTKPFRPYKLLFILPDKIDLKAIDKYFALSNLSIYYLWKNIQKPHKNNKFKTLAPTWNDKFGLPNGLYILKKHGEKTHNPPRKKNLNKIENRITFKIKTYLELLTPEMVKLLRGTKSKITKDENGENVPHLEISEVVLS